MICGTKRGVQTPPQVSTRSIQSPRQVQPGLHNPPRQQGPTRNPPTDLERLATPINQRLPTLIRTLKLSIYNFTFSINQPAPTLNSSLRILGESGYFIAMLPLPPRTVPMRVHLLQRWNLHRPNHTEPNPRRIGVIPQTLGQLRILLLPIF